MNQQKPKQRRVVVTGLGVIAPNGIGTEQFWQNCMQGVSGVDVVSQFDTAGLEAKIAGIVKGFIPSDWEISEEQGQRLDRHVLFALAASKMAMSVAGLQAGVIPDELMGVSIATAIAGTGYMEQAFLRYTDHASKPIDYSQVDRHLYPYIGFNSASTEVAAQYHLCGPTASLATGCTAGLDALGFALECIRNNEADVMLAGATEAPLTPITMAAFDIIGALSSSHNESPTEASRPFDKNRDGFVLGEGCGILVLEEYEHACRRGAPILAEVCGFGSTCNAYHMTDLPEDGEELLRSMSLALEDADIKPGQIDHVNAHGSSTPQNDVNESQALLKLMGEHARHIPVCSLKSMNGHALSAANAIEMVAAVLSLVHQQVPPTINYQTADPDCPLDYVANQGRAAAMSYVLKAASGFSGIHSAVVLKRIED
ncbi:beta-ketoacyl-[acyl-carrier-protein] synthase family protein [Zooshikella harenae]|uniref:Beta-ketoacyl-[acyl-carrier-protein] synthase family protein n=1 Tax=Zooshikella harenae TaxID=2827238 RepID=A0ABS5ZI29_9GAMM|nr:beta-ketoacyl-[acyl-carrier-protein] synthase family protein [Zooshikella harenae]MBU2713433.1 beta-ketoacyl-[acyl-carrier-protein] synthase family protein [Zooshikella harenae]